MKRDRSKSKQLYSKSGRSMNKVNFDILYASRIMDSFEEKSDEKEEKEDVWFYLFKYNYYFIKNTN